MTSKLQPERKDPPNGPTIHIFDRSAVLSRHLLNALSTPLFVPFP